MKAGFISMLLIIGFSGMLITPIGHTTHLHDEAQNQDQGRANDDIKADLARQLGLAAQKNVGADSPVSRLVPRDVTTNVARQLPSKCIDHWQKDIDKLNHGHYTRDSWFGHVQECQECCAPLMIEVFVVHITMVASGPHEVLFFDFNDDTLKDYFKEKTNSLFRENFDKNQHQVLLIGRASKTGNPIYNERLSRKRADSVKQYLVDQGMVDDDRVMTMFFGYYPPQLTPPIAKKYGIEFQELQNITIPRDDPKGDYRINQSVVIVLYKTEDSVHKTSHVDGAARSEAR